MTGRIILVRHGQTTSNVARKLDTRPPGAELTALGRYQAHQVGVDLVDFCEVSEGSLGRIEAVLCSTAIRAAQTAMLMTAAIEKAATMPPRSLNVTVRDGIQEIFAGEVEMNNDMDSHRRYAEAMHAMLRGDDSVRIPGGENYSDLMGRYQPVLEQVADAHPSGDAIIVSHGAAIRTMAARAASLDPDYALSHYLANCHFIVLTPNGKPFGQWEVSHWGDGSLPEENPAGRQM